MQLATRIEGPLETRWNSYIKKLQERGLAPKDADELRKAIDAYLTQEEAD